MSDLLRSIWDLGTSRELDNPSTLPFFPIVLENAVKLFGRGAQNSDLNSSWLSAGMTFLTSAGSFTLERLKRGTFWPLGFSLVCVHSRDWTIHVIHWTVSCEVNLRHRPDADPDGMKSHFGDWWQLMQHILQHPDVLNWDLRCYKKYDYKDTYCNLWTITSGQQVGNQTVIVSIGWRECFDVCLVTRAFTTISNEKILKTFGTRQSHLKWKRNGLKLSFFFLLSLSCVWVQQYDVTHTNCLSIDISVSLPQFQRGK